MTLYAPFGQHVFCGIFGIESQATAWVLAREWDTNEDGTGIPRSGMTAMIGETEPYGFYVYKEDGVGGGTWEEMAEAGGSVTAHDMGGSSHNADTLADISSKCSDDDLVGEDTAQTLTNKTLTTPTIGDMQNAMHDHVDNAGGGKVSHDSLDDVDATSHHDNSNDPTSDQKAALAGTVGTPGDSNRYVTDDGLQAALQGLHPKPVVRLLSKTNATLSGAMPTIDGVLVVEEDRVLLTNQTDKTENGIWIAKVAGWERPADFDTGDSAAGAYTFATEGSNFHDQGWVCITDPPDIIGTNDLVFEQFTGAGQITAGTGLTKAGDTIQIGDGSTGKIGGLDRQADEITVAVDQGLEIAAGSVQVKADGIMASMINVGVAGDGIAQGGGGELDADPSSSTVVSGHVPNSESGASVNSTGIFTAVGYAGNPNGNVTAPGGMICRDTAGGVTYINTDGADTWAVI